MAETIVITHDWKCDCGSNTFTEVAPLCYRCQGCQAEYSSSRRWGVVGAPIAPGSAHTPGLIRTDHECNWGMIRSEDGMPLADTWVSARVPDDDELSRCRQECQVPGEIGENARRIVACWNRLVSFTTEEIEFQTEQMNKPHEKRVNDRLTRLIEEKIGQLTLQSLELLEAEVAQLRKEKAELLAALEDIMHGAYDNAHDCKAAAKIAGAALLAHAEKAMIS